MVTTIDCAHLGKWSQPFTVHTWENGQKHSLCTRLIIFNIFVNVFAVDKVLASTKCLQPQLQTRLFVVLVIKHLQPLHSL